MVEQDAVQINGSSQYPYLLVRFMPTVYHSERIDISVGPPAVEFAERRCIVRHPAPFEDDGSVSAECRALIVPAVQAAVREQRFRMCVVWAANSCTYCETDSVTEYAQPPFGGIRLVPEELELRDSSEVGAQARPDKAAKLRSGAPLFEPAAFSAEAREEIASHLRVVLDQINQCQGRLPVLLSQGANIQALAAQANAYVQDKAAPASEQICEWADALNVASDVAAECSDRLYSCQLWTEGKLRRLSTEP